MKVKICGITNVADGVNAARLGADYIGFVFWHGSSRDISVVRASEISKELKGVKKVGLFVNAQYDHVSSVINQVGLDIVQFHGDEGPKYCGEFSDIEVWKALKVKDATSLDQIQRYPTYAMVLDAHVEGQEGGTGRTFDWDLTARAKEHGKNIILAGGLTPANVAEAVSRVRPYAVDVSSGVESEGKGLKDDALMRDFISAAKRE